MIHSVIDRSINYPEIRTLNNVDYDYNAAVYDALILGTKVIIAVGKVVQTFVEKNVYYYPIYLIKSNKVDIQIGLYEILADQVQIYKDKDGDIDIRDLEPLIYSYVNVEFLKRPAKEILKELVKEKSWIIPGVNALYKGLKVIVKEAHNDGELPYFTISFASGDEKHTTMENLEKIPIDKESEQEEQEEQEQEGETEQEEEQEQEQEGEEEEGEEGEEEEGEEGEEEEGEEGEEGEEEEEGEDILPIQTEEEAKREISLYTEKKDDAWINKYMKSDNYTIEDTGGDGDCFFTCVIEGLKETGEDKTILELRELLVKNANPDIFNHYKELYDMTRKELLISKKELLNLKKEYIDVGNKIKAFGPPVQENKEEKKTLMKEHIRLKKGLIQLTEERKATEGLYKEYQFLKGIDTIEAYHLLLRTNQFWADSWAISTIEKELDIKVIILSQEYYQKGDVANVVQCGDMIDEDMLNEEGNLEPKHYIIVNYIGGLHYQLIRYKNKGVFKFNEIPYQLKSNIADRCLENERGIYPAIPGFKEFVDKAKNKEQKGGYSSGSKQTSILDNLLYDKNGAILQIYSKSNPEPFPSSGAGESLGNSQPINFIKLRCDCNKNWRRKLSNFWQQKFNLDGKDWNSVQHYYEACKFKDMYPSFYNEFALGSGSELSNIPEMAKAAGSINGMFEGREVRPKSIKIDNHYFNGKNKEALLKALRAKFRDNDDLKRILLDTGDAKLQHYVHRMSPVELLDLMKVRKEIRDNK